MNFWYQESTAIIFFGFVRIGQVAPIRVTQERESMKELGVDISCLPHDKIYDLS